MNKQFSDFLDDEIKKYCDKDGFLKIPGRYDKTLDNEGNWKTERITGYDLWNCCLDQDAPFDSGIESMEDAFKEDCAFDFVAEQTLCNWIDEDSMNKFGTRINFDFNDLEKRGFNGCKFNSIKLWENSEFRLNIMLSSRYFDNVMTYIIHQQGMTIDDVIYKTRYNNAWQESRPQVDDWDYSNFSILVHLNGLQARELFNVLDKNADPSKKPKHIKIDKNVSTGVFSQKGHVWIDDNVYGQFQNIQLIRDLIVPISMIKDVQSEFNYNLIDYPCDNIGYFCNLPLNCWRESKLEYTNQAPDLVIEKLDKPVDYKNDIGDLDLEELLW